MEYKTSKIFNNQPFTHFEYIYSDSDNVHQLLFYVNNSNPSIKLTTPKQVVDFHIEQNIDVQAIPINDDTKPFINELNKPKRYTNIYNIEFIDFYYNIIETCPESYEIVFKIDQKKEDVIIGTTRDKIILFYEEQKINIPNHLNFYY
jgi:hypothetical protein